MTTHRCRTPKCGGEAIGRSIFCLDCSVDLSPELRKSIVALEREMLAHVNRPGWLALHQKLLVKLGTASVVAEMRKAKRLAKAAYQGEAS